MHWQLEKADEPTGDDMLAGHAIVRFPLPPGQYEPALQTGHGLVPTTAPLPKYPASHKQAFWEELSAAE